MLGQRKTVGHAGDEIGNATRAYRFFKAIEPLVPFPRQIAGMRAVVRISVT